MKTVILQDRTNAILKQKSDQIENKFSDYKKFSLCNKGKFQPRNIGIDGSASLKKIAEKRTGKQQNL